MSNNAFLARQMVSIFDLAAQARQAQPAAEVGSVEFEPPPVFGAAIISSPLQASTFNEDNRDRFIPEASQKWDNEKGCKTTIAGNVAQSQLGKVRKQVVSELSKLPAQIVEESNLYMRSNGTLKGAMELIAKDAKALADLSTNVKVRLPGADAAVSLSAALTLCLFDFTKALPWKQPLDFNGAPLAPLPDSFARDKYPLTQMEVKGQSDAGYYFRTKEKPKDPVRIEQVANEVVPGVQAVLNWIQGGCKWNPGKDFRLVLATLKLKNEIHKRENINVKHRPYFVFNASMNLVIQMVVKHAYGCIPHFLLDNTSTLAANFGWTGGNAQIFLRQVKTVRGWHAVNSGDDSYQVFGFEHGGKRYSAIWSPDQQHNDGRQKTVLWKTLFSLFLRTQLQKGGMSGKAITSLCDCVAKVSYDAPVLSLGATVFRLKNHALTGVGAISALNYVVNGTLNVLVGKYVTAAYLNLIADKPEATLDEVMQSLQEGWALGRTQMEKTGMSYKPGTTDVYLWDHSTPYSNPATILGHVLVPQKWEIEGKETKVVFPRYPTPGKMLAALIWSPTQTHNTRIHAAQLLAQLYSFAAALGVEDTPQAKQIYEWTRMVYTKVVASYAETNEPLTPMALDEWDDFTPIEEIAKLLAMRPAPPFPSREAFRVMYLPEVHRVIYFEKYPLGVEQGAADDPNIPAEEDVESQEMQALWAQMNAQPVDEKKAPIKPAPVSLDEEEQKFPTMKSQVSKQAAVQQRLTAQVVPEKKQRYLRMRKEWEQQAIERAYQSNLGAFRANAKKYLESFDAGADDPAYPLAQEISAEAEALQEQFDNLVHDVMEQYDEDADEEDEDFLDRVNKQREDYFDAMERIADRFNTEFKSWDDGGKFDLSDFQTDATDQTLGTAEDYDGPVQKYSSRQRRRFNRIFSKPA